MASESRQAELTETRQFWQKHIENSQNSGLSQTQYCLQNNLKANRFWYWKKRLIKKDAQPLSLVQLQFPKEALSSQVNNSFSKLRLVVGNKFRIEVERDFDPVALQQLIQTVGRL